RVELPITPDAVAVLHTIYPAVNLMRFFGRRYLHTLLRAQRQQPLEVRPQRWRPPLLEDVDVVAVILLGELKAFPAAEQAVAAQADTQLRVLFAQFGQQTPQCL